MRAPRLIIPFQSPKERPSGTSPNSRPLLRRTNHRYLTAQPLRAPRSHFRVGAGVSELHAATARWVRVGGARSQPQRRLSTAGVRVRAVPAAARRWAGTPGIISRWSAALQSCWYASCIVSWACPRPVSMHTPAWPSHIIRRSLVPALLGPGTRRKQLLLQVARRRCVITTVDHRRHNCEHHPSWTAAAAAGCSRFLARTGSMPGPCRDHAGTRHLTCQAWWQGRKPEARLPREVSSSPWGMSIVTASCCLGCLG